MVHVAFMGAAATGKTSCLQPLADKCGLVTKPSISRTFYAERGLENEAEILARPIAERHEFQRAMMMRFLETSEQFLRDNKSTIFDRTAFDHLAWVVYNNPEISLIEYKELYNLAWTSARQFDLIVYFPYPCQWHTTNDGNDGFRYVPPGKNIMIDNMIYTAWQHMKKVSFRQKRISVSESSSVEERVNNIEKVLSYLYV